MSTTTKQVRHYRTSVVFQGIIVAGEMAFTDIDAAQAEQGRINAVMRDNGFPLGSVVMITEKVW